MRFSGMASNGQFAGTRDQNSGEKRILTVDGDGNAGTSRFSESEIVETIDQVELNTNQIKDNSTKINKNTSNIDQK